VLPHPALEGKQFDIVSVIDVIEHVSDPLALLREASAYLAPGGVLAVVTPDVGSVAARLLGQRWWHFRLAHVCYFNKRSAAEVFERAGLRVRSERRAGWFFDVGYLAERMERYLPVGGLNRLVRGTPGLRAVYKLVIPLNLRDSFLILLSRSDDAAA
jgi:SAM-dependent methyltransferase